MKSKSILLLTTALLGGLLSATAASTADGTSAEVSATQKSGAPVPVRIVPPTDLPRSSMGTTVKVLLTVDAAGLPHDIKVVSSEDRRLIESLVAAIAQWEFAPATENGTPVSAKVELPIQLIGS